MTDEMMVQAQRPSAMPYVLGGAALGAAAAGAGAAVGNMGVKSPAYSSWEAAVADANKEDSFVSKQIKKGGDNKADWETIQNQAKKLQDAEKALTEYKLPDGFEGKAELEAVLDKEAELAKNTAAKDKLIQAEFDKELENLKKMEIKPESPFEYDGKKYNQEEFRKLLNSTDEADKKLVDKLVRDQQGFKDAIGKEGFAKAETESITKAEEALTKAKEELGKKNGHEKITEEIKTKFGELRKGVTTARTEASEKITEELLGKCKKASTWKNAAIGAAVLALAGFIARPKGEAEEV